MIKVTKLSSAVSVIALVTFVSSCAAPADKPLLDLDQIGFARFTQVGQCNPNVERGLGGPSKFTLVAWFNKQGELSVCSSSEVQVVDDIPSEVSEITQRWKIEYVKKILPGSSDDPCHQIKTVGGKASVCWPPI